VKGSIITAKKPTLNHQRCIILQQSLATRKHQPMIELRGQTEKPTNDRMRESGDERNLQLTTKTKEGACCYVHIIYCIMLAFLG